MSGIHNQPGFRNYMTLDTLCDQFNRFQDGDMLAMLDLIDQVNAMRQEIAAHPVYDTLISGLAAYLEVRMGDGQGLQREFIDESLAQLRRLMNESDTVKNYVDANFQKELEAWESLFSPIAASGIGNEDGKATVGDNSGQSANPFAKEEIFQVFLLDARERLETAQELCLRLEETPDDEGAIQEMFRVFHTFKGECGFFKLASIGELAHTFESLLDLARSKTLSITPAVIDLLFRGIDRFSQLIEGLSSKEMVINHNIDMDDLRKEIADLESRVRQPIGEKLVAAGMISDADKAIVLRRQKETNFTKTFGEIAVERLLIDKEDLEQVVKPSSLPDTAAQQTSSASQYIKVQSVQINTIMDMVGELIIAQDQIDSRDPAFLAMRKITRELQFTAHKLRTTKLRQVVLNAHRAARDVAQKLSKPIRFVSTDNDLEVDRDLVEGLAEPLLHLVRNAVHHGIENTVIREEQGKSAEGTITFDAKRKGNTIIISVEDDGKGLDRQAILRKAVEKGLVPPERVQTMPDREVWDLIFRPGFSTAESVNQISGRGVGMDIVRTFALANRGRVEVQTETSRFTRISLHFPINTAIIDGMVATVGDTTLIMPVNQVVESINMSQMGRYRVGDRIDVINLRGDILPVIDLGGFFGRQSDACNQRVGVVMEDTGQNRHVFVVDRLLGKREIVLKPLGTRFNYLKAISACTVLAGGRIGYIIDPDAIIQESGTASGNKEV